MNSSDDTETNPPPLDLTRQPSPIPHPSPQVTELHGDRSFRGVESDGAHLDAIHVEEPQPSAEDVAQDAGVPPELVTADGFLTQAAFVETFKSCFKIGGELTGLETLKSAPDRDTCEPAASAIYDTARSTPYLHFLVRPGNVWLQRALVIGAFTVPVARGVGQEIRQRKAMARPAPQGEEAPPDASSPAPAADVVDLPSYRAAAS